MWGQWVEKEWDTYWFISYVSETYLEQSDLSYFSNKCETGFQLYNEDLFTLKYKEANHSVLVEKVRVYPV